MTAPSLLHRTARGAGWIVAWRMLTRLLGFISTLILVRLLVPGDFGLVALASSFAQGIDQLSSLGVEEALIRERAPTRDVYDTAFTINVLRGSATAILICGFAWPVAMFFNTAALFPVLLALSGGSLVSSFENVGIVEFRRNLAFEKEFQLLVLPRLVTIFVTAGTAALYRSHWALVAGILTMQVLKTALGYAMHPFRPRFTLVAWRTLAGFSSWTWAIGVAQLVRDRVDSFVVGRIFNPTSLGIYTISGELATIATYELAAPLGRACLSGFAAARHQSESVEHVYLRVIGIVSLITLPAAVGTSLVARPLILLIFGSGWQDGAPLAEIMALAGSTFVFGTIGSTLLTSHGLLSPIFTTGVISVLLRFSLIIVLAPTFGLVGAAYGYTAAVSFENLIYIAVTVRRFQLSVIDLFWSCWRSAAATAIMAAVLYTAGYGWIGTAAISSNAALRLVCTAVLAGAAIYASGLMGFWLLCRCPAGAEADVLMLCRRAVVSIWVRTSIFYRWLYR